MFSEYLPPPPCTEFSLALNESIERDFNSGMEIVSACQRIIKKANPTWWALENPRGHLRKFIGDPALTFQPWEYGDPWTKCTDIWGNFNIPEKMFLNWEDVPKIESLYIRKPRKKPNFIWLHKSAYDLIPAYHSLPRPDSDAAFRAMTPQGFAKAFYEANKFRSAEILQEDIW